jgi:hypothetical protein
MTHHNMHLRRRSLLRSSWWYLGAQGTPTEEEEQQEEDHDINDEDKDDNEYSPLSDTEGEKLYRDAEEMESFLTEAPVPTNRLQSLLGHVGITSAPRYLIKGVPCPGSSVGTMGQPLEHLQVMVWLTPPGRPSLLGVITIRASCTALSTASCPTRRRTSSRPLG